MLLGLILLCAALIRGRLLDFPLERDEGEYAYAGQLILQGIPPYQLAYNMKLPGTYAAYAGLMAVFGQTTAGIHLGLILVTSLTGLFVFLLGRRLLDGRAAVAAAAAYVLLAMSQGVYGVAAHATHFVSLFAVAGVLVLLRAVETGRYGWYVLSGLLLGMAFLMKQHGVFFILLGAVAVVWTEWRRTNRNWRQGFLRLAFLGVGALAPYLVTCAILTWAGVFGRYWFWTFTYAREYVAQMPLEYAWEVFRKNVGEMVGPNLLLWLLGMLGLIVAWLEPGRRGAAWLTGLFVFGFLATCPGLHFRGHYFIVMLPAVALAAGAAVTWAGAALARRGYGADVVRAVPVLMCMAALGWSLWCERKVLFELTPAEASREVYPLEPFPAAPGIADYLRQHTAPGERIAVVGSEPEIYFHSGRPSATGYIYTYALMEEHPFATSMQREMIAEIEQARPRYLVMVRIPSSWVIRPKSDTMIMDWVRVYTRQHYDIVGVVEIGEDGSAFRWDAQAAGYTPNSPFVVFVFRRKDATP